MDQMEEERLATELLHELKAQSKRWFIAFCIMVGVEVLTIIGLVGGFLWYNTLPADKTVTTEQTIDDVESGNITQIGGDSYGESYTEDNR